MEVKYLKYKHIVRGSVYTDISCMRIKDHNPNAGKERKTTLGKSIPSFNSILIPLRRQNEWVYFPLSTPPYAVASQCDNCINYHCSTGETDRLVQISQDVLQAERRSEVTDIVHEVVSYFKKWEFLIKWMRSGANFTNLYLLNFSNPHLFRKLLYNFSRNKWLLCSIPSSPWVEYNIV